MPVATRIIEYHLVVMHSNHPDQSYGRFGIFEERYYDCMNKTEARRQAKRSYPKAMVLSITPIYRYID
jgi:hypothetical protein